MLSKYRKLTKKLDNVTEKTQRDINAVSSATSEISAHSEKIYNDIQHVNVIISDIDKQFSEKTGIMNPKDMAFLWSAVAIQCARWILIPTLDIDTLTPDESTRKDSAIEGRKDKTGSGSMIDTERSKKGVLNFTESDGYPNNEQIMLFPVPYDAMMGTEDIVIPGVTDLGVNLTGTNHHSATLGHDPILGQIFGTANIMTRSITFHDVACTTRKVLLINGREQRVSNHPYGLMLMIKDVIGSVSEGEKGRIATALLKENLHLQSDYNTKKGLPIPLLNPEMQQSLINRGWNSKELANVIRGAVKGIAINFVISAIVNSIVGTLHGFCYNEEKDESLSLYSVRTRKIVATSNTIAECINVAAVAGGTIAGVLTGNTDMAKKSISHIDIGGIIEAIHLIWISKKLQEEIRREFLEKELYSHFTDYKYSFLEEAHYE